MKALFIKYKWTILYWAILVFLLFYFVPKQKQYYLDDDIKQFKSTYLLPGLAIFFGILAVGLLIYWIYKGGFLIKLIKAFFWLTLYLAFLIFIFQDVFLGIALFTNRQIQTGKLAKSYKASYLAGEEPTKANFHCYDMETGKIIINSKLLNKLYRPGIQQNDILVLPMKLGLFRVPFTEYPMEDN